MSYAPPTLYAVRPLVADTIAWVHPGGSFVTIVAKLALRFENDGYCVPVAASAMSPQQRHRDKDTKNSIESPGDLVPWLPHPEWWLVGSAYIPGGRAAPASTVQVSLSGGSAVVRKHLHVHGDRRHYDQAGEPFRTMPLIWERARASEHNPVGVLSPKRPPNVESAVDPKAPGGFAPLSERWHVRRRLVASSSPPKLTEGEPIVISEELDAEFFQAAPRDQWLEELTGGEWLALDGLHPVLPRVLTRLPGMRVVARLQQGGSADVQEIGLSPDRLALDTDAQTATLHYRVVVPTDHATVRERTISLGMGRSGEPIAWPDTNDPETLCPHMLRVDEPRGDIVEDDEPFHGTVAMRPVSAPEEGDGELPFNETMGLRPEALVAEALPFDDVADAAEQTRDEPPRPQVQATPFDPDPQEEGQAVPVQALPFPESGAPPPSRRPPGERPGTVLPFGPAGTPPPDPTGPPSSPPHIAAVRPPPIAPPRAPASSTSQRAGEPGTEMPGNDTPRSETPRSEMYGSETPGSDTPGSDTPRSETPAGGEAFASGEPPPEIDTASQDPPRPPERIAEQVPWLTADPLAVATVPWKIKPPQDSLTVIIKASFALVPDGPASLLDEPELLGGDIFTGDAFEGALEAASDFAILKPEVDVLVRGHVHAPKGRARRAVARVAVRGPQPLERRIAVFGDRTWSHRTPSEPEPFDAMPITHERAFGGSEMDDNPVGSSAEKPPNFEDPEALITSQSDKPKPACFSPISPVWKARWGLLGTYDAAWFHERWPYFAKDFDYRYFQSAPPSQRLPAINGDEAYELDGLHPEHAELRGTLPAMRVQCFARHTEASGGTFEEVGVRIDTVTFDADTGRVHLVWRGVLDVRDDEASEIAQLFATITPLEDAPLAVDAARERYLEVLAAPKLETPFVEPEPVAQAEEPPPPAPTPLEVRLSEVEASLAESSSSLDGAHAAPPHESNVETLIAGMRAAGASEEDLAEIAAALEDEDPPASPIDLRATVEARLERDEPLAGMSLRGANLSYLNFDGRSLAGADLTDANLDHASMQGTDLEGATMVRADLSSVEATGARLGECDLTDAVMDHAVLIGASLSHTQLLRVRAAHADFTSCVGPRAKFVESDLSGARFDDARMPKADFTKANLDGASYARAMLPDVRLYMASGKVTFEAADLTGARAESVSFEGGTFTEVRADGSVWERASLAGASFRAASLVKSSFERAEAEGAIFAGSDLRSVRMKKCRMSGAFFTEANLMDAVCDRGDFSLVDFRGANLHGSVFNASSLRSATLDGAILSYSTIHRTQP